jgi:uncharacterized protein YecT (DUF1311 family)
MNILGSTIAAATLLSFATPSHAGDVSQSLRKRAPAGITETFFSCTDKAGGDLAAQAGCVSVEKKVQDARLNRAYAAVMAKVSGKAKEDLKAAERSWLTFNDKSYDAELAIHGVDQTAGIDTATSELFRYCQRANALDDLAFAVGE